VAEIMLPKAVTINVNNKLRLLALNSSVFQALGFQTTGDFSPQPNQLEDKIHDAS